MEQIYTYVKLLRIVVVGDIPLMSSSSLTHDFEFDGDKGDVECLRNVSIDLGFVKGTFHLPNLLHKHLHSDLRLAKARLTFPLERRTVLPSHGLHDKVLCVQPRNHKDSCDYDRQ